MATRKSTPSNVLDMQARMRQMMIAQIKPVEKDQDKLGLLASTFGGVRQLVEKIHFYLTARERATRWRVVNDAASGDRSTYGKTPAERQDLDVPFPPLTLFLASESGEGENWDRDAILQALAALADEPEASKSLSIRHSANVNVPTPYASVSIARKGNASLRPEQEHYFAFDEHQAR